MKLLRGELTRIYHLREGTSEVRVQEGSTLAGKTLLEGAWGKELNLTVLGISHDDQLTLAPDPEIEIQEEQLPVGTAVRNACDLLGFDPLYVANEGKLVAFVPERELDETLEVMRASKYGKGAARIGQVVSGGKACVFMKTRIGGRRFVDMLVGEQFPRIC